MSSVDRRELIRSLMECRGDGLVVTGLGSPTYDVGACGDDDLNFYLWGAMGGSAMVGLGIALAQPDRRVMVVTGDGEILMGIGSLSVIAAQAPTNLTIVVLDNEGFGETGEQTGLTGRGVDLAAIADASGFRASFSYGETQEPEGFVERLWTTPGPVFATVKVPMAPTPITLVPREGVYVHWRFRQALLGTGTVGEEA